jgi:hypothetical protein
VVERREALVKAVARAELRTLLERAGVAEAGREWRGARSAQALTAPEIPRR